MESHSEANKNNGNGQNPADRQSQSPTPTPTTSSSSSAPVYKSVSDPIPEESLQTLSTISGSSSVIQMEMDYMLQKLEYMNGPNAVNIFCAFDKQIKDWEVVAEDLTRMEGRLERSCADEQMDPNLLVFSSADHTNILKAVTKMQAIVRMAAFMDGVLRNGEHLSGMLNKIAGDETVGDHLSTQESDSIPPLPLGHRCIEIFHEIIRRSNLLIERLNRRFLELGIEFDEDDDEEED